MNLEFFLTSLVVILIPGTGVIYTITTGLFRGPSYVTAAALGCTFGIIPHILASTLGLAALLHTSALAFQFVKYAGAAYLIYMAYGMWKESGQFQVSNPEKKPQKSHAKIMLSGALINVLNPKLSIFFLAFLPQFITNATTTVVYEMVQLGLLFMIMTFAVFLVYGYSASWMRHHVIENPRITRWLQRGFSAIFVSLGLKLALEER